MSQLQEIIGLELQKSSITTVAQIVLKGNVLELYYMVNVINLESLPPSTEYILYLKYESYLNSFPTSCPHYGGFQQGIDFSAISLS